MNVSSNYFRINQKEYCHITDDVLFIVNGKDVKRIPLEHDLSEAWGIVSVLNYLVFTVLFVYVTVSVNTKGADFFMHLPNYGALLLMVLSFMRIHRGTVTSRTPTIRRNKIRSTVFETPVFSFPRLTIYFEGPEGKVLQKIVPVLYKQEALQVLEKTGLLK